MTLIGVGFTLLSPLPLAFLADYIFGDKPVPTILGHSFDYPKQQLLFMTAAAYLLILVASNVYDSIADLVEQKLFQIVDAHSMQDVTQSALSVPYNSNSGRDSGEYLYKITGQSQVMAGFILGNFSVLLQSVVTVIVIAIILLRVDWQLTLLIFLLAPTLVYIVKLFGKHISRSAEQVQDAETDIYEHLSTTFQKVKTVQEFSLEGRRTQKLDTLISKRNKADRKFLIIGGLYSLSTESTILVGISVLILLGGNMVLGGAMTFGALLLYINYVSSMSDPMVTVANTISGMREQAVSLRQAHELVSLGESERIRSGSVRDAKLEGLITYDRVSYSVDGKILADDLSIEFTPGNVYVITGSSGEGKSTILSMLQRFVHPQSGRILIDGVDVKEYDLHFLRRSIAVVDQQPELFEGSVLENITISDPEREFSELYVSAAVDTSGSKSFIDQLPEKYQTDIGDNRLSGGQKQRIAIARAYYRRSPIVIMDEPTSALDKQTANLFLDNIEKYYSNRTVLIVTHDINVIRHFKNVFVLREGKMYPYQQDLAYENIIDLEEKNTATP